MIRINYITIGNYLVSKKNFSTREHEELVYVAINLKTFAYCLVPKITPRTISGLSDSESTFCNYGSSLVDAKKKVKKLLVDSGVSFNIEVRNRKISDG